MQMCVLLCAFEQKAGVSCDTGSGNSWINMKKKNCLVGIWVVQLKTFISLLNEGTIIFKCKRN